MSREGGLRKREEDARACEVAVIWIDWYAYHVARFNGLNSTPTLTGKVVGIELVSGEGVHPGLRFRETLPEGLAVETLLPGVGWAQANKLRLAALLWKRLSALNPQVVLVPGYYTVPGIAAALWARMHRRGSVLMTESTAFDHRRRPLQEWLKQKILQILFNWAVTGGKAHVRYLEQLRFPSERILGCYDVVDNGAIQSGTARSRMERRGVKDPTPYFLFVGRLAEEKDVESLLNSWVKYREQGGQWNLVLAGDGPRRAALESIAASTPFREGVHFTGLKGMRELIPMYAAAGCFVLPSTREPWGLVVNEAMAAELPVLVSRCCGCREDLVLEGENGFSFEARDQVHLTELLWNMERLSPEARARMAECSAEIISRFTPRDFGRSVASIVRDQNRAGRLHLLQETTR